MTVSSLKTTLRSICCVVIIAILAGCSLTHIGQQTARLENLSTIQGQVTVKTGDSGPVHILLFRHTGMGLEVLSHQSLLNDGSYQFYVDARLYTVGAFVDINDDGEYIGNEPATYNGQRLGKLPLLEVIGEETLVIDELVIEGVLDRALKRLSRWNPEFHKPMSVKS
ncbi:MAG: hypothetical protein ACI9JM_001826 [Halioglobus sp.]|jgi:hypothetical protein